MRKSLSIFIGILISACIYAAVPQKMSYQAVIRNINNNIVANKQVGMRISIIKGTITGTTVYSETQTPTSNINGLITIEIGSGSEVTGNLLSINWSDDIYFIKTETDPEGSTNYTITGVSQLLSVPYALHANSADNYTETDPIYTASPASNITTTHLTKLGNLSGTNTGDQDLSGLATTSQLATKVDKVDGKGLSTNDYTSTEKTKLAGIAEGATVYTDGMADSRVTAGITGKVDKVDGKGLSTNDYTNTEKTKLAGIAAGATVYNDGMADSRVTAGITGKVDKVDGKGLSTNDYTNTEKTKLAGIAEGATVYTDGMADSRVTAGITGKVDKVDGKGLSTNDYTNTEKTKLAGIAAGATVYNDGMADSRVTAGITGKVDKVDGKGLSTNDYTNTEKTKLAGIAEGATVYTDGMADSRVTAGITGKVDKVDGKGLSTNDYTSTEKTKLAGIAEGATVYTDGMADLRVSSGITAQNFGTLSKQNANSVAITGGSINNVTLGSSNPSAGTFSTLRTTGNTTLGSDRADTLRINALVRGNHLNYPDSIIVITNQSATGVIAHLENISNVNRYGALSLSSAAGDALKVNKGDVSLQNGALDIIYSRSEQEMNGDGSALKVTRISNGNAFAFEAIGNNKMASDDSNSLGSTLFIEREGVRGGALTVENSNVGNNTCALSVSTRGNSGNNNAGSAAYFYNQNTNNKDYVATFQHAGAGTGVAIYMQTGDNMGVPVANSNGVKGLDIDIPDFPGDDDNTGTGINVNTNDAVDGITVTSNGTGNALVLNGKAKLGGIVLGVASCETTGFVDVNLATQSYITIPQTTNNVGASINFTGTPPVQGQMLYIRCENLQGFSWYNFTRTGRGRYILIYDDGAWRTFSYMLPQD